MSTKKDAEKLLSLLDAQVVTEHHFVRTGGLEVLLWTVFRPPTHPSLPKRLRPLWERLKPSLLKTAATTREKLRARLERRVRTEEQKITDGYTQSTLL